jgi:hypothetical protein
MFAIAVYREEVRIEYRTVPGRAAGIRIYLVDDLRRDAPYELWPIMPASHAFSETRRITTVIDTTKIGDSGVRRIHRMQFANCYARRCLNFARGTRTASGR